MNPNKKPNLIRIFIWLVYLCVSIGLAVMAGGLSLLTKKTSVSINIPVLVIASLIALFSILRIYLELRRKKAKVESVLTGEESLPENEVIEAEIEDIKLCVHCGKAEPLDTVYCSSCGNRFP
jgi:hypothetical protein